VIVTSSLARPPQRKSGNPPPPQLKNCKLTSRFAVNVPVARTLPWESLCTTVPTPLAVLAATSNAPAPYTVMVSPLSARAIAPSGDPTASCRNWSVTCQS
jgi:hypothetical protein